MSTAYNDKYRFGVERESRVGQLNPVRYVFLFPSALTEIHLTSENKLFSFLLGQLVVKHDIYPLALIAENISSLRIRFVFVWQQSFFGRLRVLLYPGCFAAYLDCFGIVT